MELFAVRRHKCTFSSGLRHHPAVYFVFGTPDEVLSGKFISHQHVDTATLGFQGALYELVKFSVDRAAVGCVN